MKIVQVATGLITIPPNGWGAVERIIWEYHTNLLQLGVNSEIKNWNEVVAEENMIVHCHMANTALDMRNRGIPYIYSLHDHHAEWYGKDSDVYRNNLEAIKGSVFSICHSKHVMEYFDETDKLFFLTHGVNTEFFKFRSYRKGFTNFSLLMVCNNGLGGDVSFDRKGFRYAIEAAKELHLPITIAGPENNLNFFEHHKDLLEYEGLTLKCTNPTDDETLELYQTHDIFMAPSMLEYGHPNLSILEAMSCGLPIVGKCNKYLPGMVHLDFLCTETVIDGIKTATKNIHTLRDIQLEEREQYDWLQICKQLQKFYNAASVVTKNWTSEDTRNAYLKVYV